MKRFFKSIIKRLKSIIKRLITRSPPSWMHGMTSIDEQLYFRHYAERIFRGKGEIVDLGCWLGSTTISLAGGLLKNRAALKKGRLIHAYDVFIWESWMDAHKTGCRKPYEPGESFLDEYRARVQPYEKLVKIYPGDLTKTSWTGNPIEFLLIDAMKSWELAQAIVRNFYPSLILGTSYLLHQDFKHYYTPWIHQVQYRLRDHFEPIHNVHNSGSMAFRCTNKIENDFTWLNGLKSWTEEEINAAFAYSLSVIGNESDVDKDEVLAAKIMYYVHSDRISEAKALLADVLGPKTNPLPNCFTFCQQALTSK